jgi:DNA-binding MarR family transcriptional regulator
LTTLFEQIAAAEKSVRAHVRTLKASGLVDEQPHPVDGRAKLLALTPRGIDDLATHLIELHSGREDAIQA